MKVIGHGISDSEYSPGDTVLVSMDRYEFEAIAGTHRTWASKAQSLDSLTATEGKPEPDQVTIDGRTYFRGPPVKPADWRPAVGQEFILRMDISDARGNLRQVLKQLDEFHLIAPKPLGRIIGADMAADGADALAYATLSKIVKAAPLHPLARMTANEIRNEKRREAYARKKRRT